ncbi:MAG: hypothetical protein RIE86_09135 [Imperialibacter sp.]|uniref:hypothetical protein n=1 Tax=Imperialibacter sp. TaxID=2038411 RepID=UPI0032EC220D
MPELTVNGRAYDAIDTKIVMLGTEVRGCAAASYGFEREHKNEYALGSEEPHSFRMGPKTYPPGSITLHMEEMVAIEDATGGEKDVTKIRPFTTIFTYLSDANKIVSDQVVWKFANWGREVKIEGNEAREYAMHIISIKPNVL